MTTDGEAGPGGRDGSYNALTRCVDASRTTFVINQPPQEDMARACPICGNYNRDIDACFRCPLCIHEFICKTHRVQAGSGYLCQVCATPKKTNWEQLIGEARGGSTEAGAALRSYSLSLLDKVYEAAFSLLFDLDTARVLMRRVITQTLEHHVEGDDYPTALRVCFRSEVCHQLTRASAGPVALVPTLGKLEECIRRLPIDRRLALHLDGCGMAPEEIRVLIPDPPPGTLLKQARAAVLSCLEQRSPR